MADEIDLITRYEQSNKIRPAQAKSIPDNPVNMVDQNNEFQDGFTTKASDGARITKFTAKAMEWYDEEYNTIVIPEGFTTTEEGISLNRWSPKKKYYAPGQHPG